jgi:hypothetical protein
MVMPAFIEVGSLFHITGTSPRCIEPEIFLGEGRGLGQGPGLLGYGFKISDRTIGV